MSCCDTYKKQNKNFCADCGKSLKETYFDTLPNDIIQELYKTCSNNNHGIIQYINIKSL